MINDPFFFLSFCLFDSIVRPVFYSARYKEQSLIQSECFFYLLQLMMMSSGRMRLFSMPIFGWSPLPRKRPGGSIRKFPMRSLWLSIRQ